MVNRTVATKLTEEEHEKFIDACNKKGCTPSVFLRESINERINNEKRKEIESVKIKEESRSKEMSLEDLAEQLGMNKTPKDKPATVETEKPKPTLEETLDHMKNCRNSNCKYGKMNLLKKF